MLPMTTRVLTHLIGKSATRLYPAEVRDPFDGARGELSIDISRCILCKTCARKCPSQCITVEPSEGLWQLDPFACLSCGVCVDTCPKQCLSFLQKYRPPMEQREMISLHGEPKKPRTSPKGHDAPSQDHPEGSP